MRPGDQVEALRLIEREDAAQRKWLLEVSKAAQAFEARWTRSALKRVDPQLHAALSEQHAMFDDVCVTGTRDQIEMHGPATCRGYAAAIKCMEAAGAADDAYLIGVDPKTGFKVAIGRSTAAVERVTEVEGGNAIFVSPDEVATILAGLESFKALAVIKRAFPGAEVVDRYPDQPAKADAA